MSFLTQEQFQLISKRCRLQEEQEQILHKSLRRSVVKKLMIRQLLCEENGRQKEAYFLLEGSVHLITTLINGQKSIVCEVNRNQFLNFQIIQNQWKNKFTIAVSSSLIRYVVFEDKDILMISSKMKQQIQQLSAFRQKKIVKKNKVVKQQMKRKRLDEQIKKLSLPNIDMRVLKKHPNIINTAQNVQENIKSLQNLPTFSKLARKLSKENSKKRLQIEQSQKQLKISNSDHNLQAVSERLVDQFHQYRDKIVQKKLERLKSQRSISLNEKQPKQISYSRNEIIFKEQLKNIVRRKLLFERNHFKILRKFNNRDERYRQEENKKEMLKKYEQTAENPIDNYFNM